MLQSLARRNPIVVQFSQQPPHFLSSLSLPCVGRAAFLWFFVWLFINLMMREQTLIPGFATRFCFVKIDTRADANIHKAIACKYIPNSICMVVGEWHRG